MRNFNKNYNSIEIYSNFEIFKLKDLPLTKNLINISAPIISLIEISILMKLFKISKFDFEKIYKPCIRYTPT